MPALIGLALVAGKHLSGSGATAKVEGSLHGSRLQQLMALLVLVVGVTLFANGILQRVLV